MEVSSTVVLLIIEVMLPVALLFKAAWVLFTGGRVYRVGLFYRGLLHRGAPLLFKVPLYGAGLV